MSWRCEFAKLLQIKSFPGKKPLKLPSEGSVRDLGVRPVLASQPRPGTVQCIVKEKDIKHPTDNLWRWVWSVLPSSSCPLPFYSCLLPPASCLLPPCTCPLQLHDTLLALFRYGDGSWSYNPVDGNRLRGLVTFIHSLCHRYNGDMNLRTQEMILYNDRLNKSSLHCLHFTGLLHQCNEWYNEILAWH